MQAMVEICFRNDFGELFGAESLGEVHAETLDEVIGKASTMTQGRFRDFHACRECSEARELTLLSEGVRSIAPDYEAEEVTTSFLRIHVRGYKASGEVSLKESCQCPIRGDKN